MSRAKTFATEGIVLKRVSVGETDRIVTLLTKDFGKLVGVAKGIRSLTSSKRAHLEPGNRVKVFAVKTKSLPLITQATLIKNVQGSQRETLIGLRRLSQVLEVFDRLFVEEDEDQLAYLKTLEILELLTNTYSYQKMQDLLGSLLEHLGYQNYQETTHNSVLDYVAEITEKPMKSFEYLRVK